MPTYEFDHMHIFTEDVEQTVAFYKKMFGMTELRRIDEDGKYLVHLATENARIVVSPSSAENSGMNHFALKVSDLAEAIEDLNKNGFELNQQSINQVSKYQNVFVKDNNGISIELINPATK